MTTPSPHRLLARAALAALPAVCAACAAIGGGGGGGDNLPNRGIVPYTRVEPSPEQPFVLVPDEPISTRLLEPSATLADGSIVLLLERFVASTGTADIARATASLDGAELTPLQPLLSAEGGPDWLEGRVGAPSALRVDEGWLVAFAFGADRGIGLARGPDLGSLTIDPTPLLSLDEATDATMGSPSLVAIDGGFELYTQVLPTGEGARPHIELATADADLRFTRVGPVLEAGTGCLAADGDPVDCWDVDGVGAPEVRVARTAAGRQVRRLFYTGFDGSRGDLGFAASWDGITWSRFVFNPVIGEPADERQATNLRLDAAYLLYYAESRVGGASGISLAIDAEGRPSDTF